MNRVDFARINNFFYIHIKYIIYLLTISFLWSSCCPPRLEGYGVHGIDVSHYQGKINWRLVKRDDIRFSFIKATEGISIKDSRFQTNWEQTKEVGIIRGPYHFFRPKEDPIKQAAFFTKQFELEKGDLPPVLDVEVRDDVPIPKIRQGITAWLDTIQKVCKIKPIVYTNHYFYKTILKGHIKDYPIWIANYSPFRKEIKERKFEWLFWQYSDEGCVQGIESDVDMNVYRKSFPALKQFLYKSNPPTKKPDKDKQNT